MKKAISKDERELTVFLRGLRAKLEREFTPDTAAQGVDGNGPAAGQCAAVAAIVNALLGGALISANVKGHSHWFNQIPVGLTKVEVDLTGDQYGRAPLQVATPWSLYSGSRIRTFPELTPETLARAAILAERAGLADVESDLRKKLQHRLEKEASV
jgi:hypothetical protein